MVVVEKGRAITPKTIKTCKKTKIMVAGWAMAWDKPMRKARGQANRAMRDQLRLGRAEAKKIDCPDSCKDGICWPGSFTFSKVILHKPQAVRFKGKWTVDVNREKIYYRNCKCLKLKLRRRR